MMMTTEFEFQIEIQQILVTTAEVESIQKLSKFEEWEKQVEVLIIRAITEQRVRKYTGGNASHEDQKLNRKTGTNNLTNTGKNSTKVSLKKCGLPALG